MVILSEKEILKEAARKMYGQDPLGWKVCATISDTQRPGLLIVGKNEGWLVKRDSLYSNAPGIGGRIEGPLDLKIKSSQYGLRPLPESVVEKMMLAIVEGGIESRDVTEIIKNIFTKDPVTFDEIERIRPPGILRGPIVRSYKPIQSIVGGQLELDMQLEEELEKLQRMKTSYIS